MKTKKYKTLKAQSRQTSQLTLKDIIFEQMYHDSSREFVRVENDEYGKAIDQVVELIGGRKPGYVRSGLGRVKSHWYLVRFIYSPERDRFEYCAGQDYVSEMREIRKYLYNL